MPRVARQAENHRLFREVNERIAELSVEQLRTPEEAQSFFCECNRIGCRDMLDIPLRVYEIVRDAEDTYIVLPGHEDPEHEQTLTDRGSYLIVSLAGSHTGSRRQRPTPDVSASEDPSRLGRGSRRKN